jgi:multidrug efflux pump subunit AcrA (membrane-fusion protein)
VRNNAIAIVRVVAPLAVLWLGWMGFQAIAQRPEQETRPPDADHGQLVETIAVETADDGLVVDVDGLVVPYREISLAAEVAGRVTFKDDRCRTGWYVERGTKLLEIDTEVYEIQRDAARAELEQASINLDEVRTVERPNLTGLQELATRKQEIARDDLARVRKLNADGLATPATVEAREQASLQIDNEVTTLANQLRMLGTKELRLEQAVEVATARLKSAERDLRRATVTAPVSGVVVQDSVELDGFVPLGSPLVVIEDTSKVEVRCNLTLDEMGWLWRDERAGSSGFETATVDDEGSVPPIDPRAPPENADGSRAAYKLPPIPVTVSFDLAGRHYEWQGRFARFDGIGLDEKTRTIPVRIEVPNPRTFEVDGSTAEVESGPRALLRGMYVGVRANVRPTTTLLRVPERAVKPGGDVWRFTPGESQAEKSVAGTLDVLPIDIAWREAGLVYVVATSSPLAAGDRLVVTPMTSPAPGTKLRNVEDEPGQPETPVK